MSIGVSKAEFDASTPNEINCYHLAEVMRQRREDAARWQMGMYNMSAFGTILSRAFAGKHKSKAEYIKEPFSEKQLAKHDEIGMTEEEKKFERDKLLMALQTMQANFELSHEGKGE